MYSPFASLCIRIRSVKLVYVLLFSDVRFAGRFCGGETTTDSLFENTIDDAGYFSSGCISIAHVLSHFYNRRSLSFPQSLKYRLNMIKYPMTVFEGISLRDMDASRFGEG